MRYLTLVGGVVTILYGANVFAAEPISDDYRFGLGVGYAFPADLRNPNVVVASFYYKGLEIQPSVVLENTTADMDDGVVVASDSEKTTAVGATFRYPISRRDKMDLQLIGSLNYGRSSADPEGPDNAATSKTIEISYGLGLQWWFDPHFSLMAMATNPVYQSAKTRTESIGATVKSTDRSYGIVWDPQITFAVMAWF